MDEMECDLVEVSAHAGARVGDGLEDPGNHAWWQGKVYSRSGRSSKYPDFVESTGYGTGEGLGGWNCRHSFFPYYEGVSRPAYTDEQLEELNSPLYTYQGKDLTEYEATQRQRAMERQIRRWKREKAALEAAGQDSSDAAAKLAKANERLRKFLDATGLKHRYSSERVEKPGMPGGKSAGGDFDIGNPISSPPEMIARVDFADKSAVMAQLLTGEAATKDLDHEVHYTVTADGKVWRVEGSAGYVDASTIPSSLTGSYAYHNHPREKTWFSFSAEDVAFFIFNREAYSKASDYLFEYFMRRTEKTVELDYHTVYHRFREIEDTEVRALIFYGEIDPDMDGFHEVMKRISREMGFEYERKERNQQDPS